MSSLMIIASGIFTGIVLSLFYYNFSAKSDDSETQNKNSQNISRGTDLPESWDGESELIECQNCSCLNISDYYVCRICTSDLYDRKTVEEKNVDSNTDAY